LDSYLDFLAEKLTLRYHATLNKKLFDGEHLKGDVREKLLQIGHQWQEFAHIPDSIVTDIIMTGGNCQFNYTKYSDIDVHIVIDKKVLTKTADADMVDDYLADKKALWSQTRHILVKGYTVELYAQAVDDHLVASGVYSLQDDEWLIKPVHGKYNFSHDEALQNKVDEIKSTINDMIERQVSSQEFKLLKDKIKNMRKAALASGNEFSFENLVFKELRNQGVLDKMNKYLQNLKDKELSLD
jgi:hypothetical protein